jgi:hypothetical protein
MRSSTRGPVALPVVARLLLRGRRRGRFAGALRPARILLGHVAAPRDTLAKIISLRSRGSRPLFAGHFVGVGLDGQGPAFFGKFDSNCVGRLFRCAHERRETDGKNGDYLCASDHDGLYAFLIVDESLNCGREPCPHILVLQRAVVCGQHARVYCTLGHSE